jgi:hypothetical protein
LRGKLNDGRLEHATGIVLVLVGASAALGVPGGVEGPSGPLGWTLSVLVWVSSGDRARTDCARLATTRRTSSGERPPAAITDRMSGSDNASSKLGSTFPCHSISVPMELDRVTRGLLRA